NRWFVDSLAPPADWGGRINACARRIDRSRHGSIGFGMLGPMRAQVAVAALRDDAEFGGGGGFVGEFPRAFGADADGSDEARASSRARVATSGCPWTVEPNAFWASARALLPIGILRARRRGAVHDVQVPAMILLQRTADRQSSRGSPSPR